MFSKAQNLFKKKRLSSGSIVSIIAIIFASVIAVTTSLQAQSTEKKMGIPEGADPIHETYIPVVTPDFETLMRKDVE